MRAERDGNMAGTGSKCKRDARAGRQTAIEREGERGRVGGECSGISSLKREKEILRVSNATVFVYVYLCVCAWVCLPKTVPGHLAMTSAAAAAVKSASQNCCY